MFKEGVGSVKGAQGPVCGSGPKCRREQDSDKILTNFIGCIEKQDNKMRGHSVSV